MSSELATPASYPAIYKCESVRRKEDNQNYILLSVVTGIPVELVLARLNGFPFASIRLSSRIEVGLGDGVIRFTRGRNTILVGEN